MQECALRSLTVDRGDNRDNSQMQRDENGPWTWHIDRIQRTDVLLVLFFFFGSTIDLEGCVAYQRRVAGLNDAQDSKNI